MAHQRNKLYYAHNLITNKLAVYLKTVEQYNSIGLSVCQFIGEGYYGMDKQGIFAYLPTLLMLEKGYVKITYEELNPDLNNLSQERINEEFEKLKKSGSWKVFNANTMYTNKELFDNPETKVKILEEKIGLLNINVQEINEKHICVLQVLKKLAKESQVLKDYCIDQGWIDWEDESIEGCKNLDEALLDAGQLLALNNINLNN